MAHHKIKGLLKAGAKITVIAPEISNSIRRFNRRVTLVERTVAKPDISPHYALIFAATGAPDVNQTIGEWCETHRILCNTIDEPEAQRFIVPAILRRGAVTIAISTSGVNPFFARKTKEHLHELIGPEYTIFSRLLKKYRLIIKHRFPQVESRLEFWKTLFDMDPLASIRNGDSQKIETTLNMATGTDHNTEPRPRRSVRS